MPIAYPTPARHRRLPAILALALAALAGPLAAEERRTERSFEAASIQTVELENLAGSVEVVAATTASVRIEAVVHAEASAGESAAALLDALELELAPTGNRLIVKANYPLDRHRRYHYDPEGRGGEEHGWLIDWLGGSGSNVRYQGHEVRVTSKRSDSAATLWADFRIEVPAGIAVQVKNAVGRIASTGVGGRQQLDAASGDIDVTGGRGALIADTGSGDVTVTDLQGDASVDTGSGDVVLEQVTGAKLQADTGSGNVNLVDCRGALHVDTGSGDIRGRGLVLGATLRADTGSGDVRLAGDFGAVRDLAIDTGSGDVVLDVAAVPSVHLVVSTGSGDIEVDLPDMQVRKTKGDFIADLGGGGGKAVVDTGSGDVRIARMQSN